ncbi:MAG: hypothetical protein SF162_02340 [bacterium]|nr:hypothetical protein [bacterium]
MRKLLNSSPVARHLLSVLDDGEVVVAWSETLIQNIHSGQLIDPAGQITGRRLTDAELERLQELHHVEHYNRSYVWLYALPEQPRFASVRTYETAERPRYYYLNTTVPAEQQAAVQAFLEQSGLSGLGAEAHIRDEIVAVTGERGMLFVDVLEAESALAFMLPNAPDWLAATTIAFAESAAFGSTPDAEDEAFIDLEALIADQDAKRAASQQSAPRITPDESSEGFQ